MNSIKSILHTMNNQINRMEEKAMQDGWSLHGKKKKGNCILDE